MNATTRALVKAAAKAAVIKALTAGGTQPLPVDTSIRVPLRKSMAPAVTQDEQDKRPFSLAKCLRGMTFGVWHGAEREFSEYNKRFVQKAMMGSTDTAGGFLVPDQTNADIIELLREDSVFRRIGCRIQPMTRSVMNTPRVISGSTTSWGAEATALTASTAPLFGQVKLIAKKLTSKIEVANELIADASPAIENIVRMDMSAEMGLAEDLAYAMGSGVGDVPMGIINTTGVTEVTTVAKASFGETKLRALKLAVRNQSAHASAWLMTPELWDIVEQLESANGWRLVNPDLKVDGQRRLMGLPVYETTEMISGTDQYIFCGAWKDAVIGQRMNLELSASQHEKFSSDLTVVKGIMRVDFALRHPEAFAFCTVTAT